MVIYIVAVGRLRHQALKSACGDFERRARRYFDITVREVPSPPGRRPADVRKAEAAKLRDRIPEGARMFALTRAGVSLDSAGFATRIADWMRTSRDVALLIGGAHGLDERLRERCEMELSLSSLTFPHELARLILLEQLYRAGTILRGEPYHKGARDGA